MARHIVPVWERQIETARFTAEQALAGVLQCVLAMSENVSSLSRQVQAFDGRAADTAPLRAQCELMRRDFETMLIGLQFGDRMDQMLRIVCADMQRFAVWAEHDATDRPVDPARWLDDLHARYTMPEQRARHHDTEPEPPNSGSIEFF